MLFLHFAIQFYRKFGKNKMENSSSVDNMHIPRMTALSKSQSRQLGVGRHVALNSEYFLSNVDLAMSLCGHVAV